MTELSHSKLKYDWFKKAVSSTTYQLNIVRIYAYNAQWIHGLAVRDSGVAIGCAGCAMHTGSALWGQNLPDVVFSSKVDCI